MMELSIIIVNWNSRDFLASCLESVRKFTHGIDYEIIVIDSGSFDGAGEMLQSRFPDVVFIQSDRNVGFARANNMAFRHARGEYVLFLNPDTELTSAAVNIALAHARAHPDAGAVGCRLLNGDGSLQTSCIQAFPTIVGQFLSSEVLMKLFPRSTLWGMSALFQAGNDFCEVEVISGACLMVRHTAFESVGGFSEDYFMYTEDVDLCYKLRCAGYRNHYLPAATVKHFGGGSSESAPSNFSVVMMRDSIMRYFVKYRGFAYATAYRYSTLVAAAMRITLYLALLPLHRIVRPLSRQKGTARKWLAILQWSLNPGRAHKALTQKAS